MVKELTLAGLKRKLKALGDVTDEQRAEIACALIGHSHIVETFMGYIHCGRCGAQVGDSLTQMVNWDGRVIVGHGCEQCVENAKGLTWKDTYLSKPHGLEVSP